jgi:hypothetical protein
LLELSVEWDGLEDIRSRFAAALRVFGITKYPLDWLGDRALAWVTVNADGDTLELPLHVALEEIQRRLQSTDGDLLSAIAPLAERVVVAAADNQGIVLAGAYADLAFRAEISGLLDSDVGEADPSLSLGMPRVGVRSDGWEPIGLGAIQDLVQDAFGPVDLDRSLVALPPTKAPRAGCPACAGSRFGFPADLAEAVPAMCARASGGGTRHHRVENPPCSHEQHRGHARDRAWLLPGERRSRSRRWLPDTSASPHRSRPERSVPVRKRPQVQKTAAGADAPRTGRSHGDETLARSKA